MCYLTWHIVKYTCKLCGIVVSLQVIDTDTGEKGCEVKSIQTELSLEASKNLAKRQPTMNRQLSGGDKNNSDGECTACTTDMISSEDDVTIATQQSF